ncbi:MAG: hypothetical protein IJ506_03210 [Clostridia bacterium]|nr:hypothetical protein [Clostridia bacterium]
MAQKTGLPLRGRSSENWEKNPKNGDLVQNRALFGKISVLKLQFLCDIIDMLKEFEGRSVRGNFHFRGRQAALPLAYYKKIFI